MNSFKATSKQQLSANWKFHVPDLKVGTLDQLVGLSDDLGKLDGFVEQITRKVSNYLGEVLEDQRDKLGENLLANGVDLATYVTQFRWAKIVFLKTLYEKAIYRWDMAKYPIKQSLKNLSDIISKQVSQIESDLKSKATAYNSLKSNLQSIEKKQTGSLVTRYYYVQR